MMPITFKFFIFSIFLISTLYSSQIELTKKEKIYLEKNPKIGLVGTLHIQPYIIKNDNGTLSGVIPEYLDLLSKKIGNKIFIKELAQAGMGHKLSKEKGFYGHAILIDTQKTREIHNLTDSYMKTPYTIFTTKALQSTIKEKSDLINKKVAVLRGHFGMLEYLEKIDNITIIECKTPKEQLQLLQKSNVDVIVGYVNYHKLITQYFFTNTQFAYSTPDTASVLMGINDSNKELVSIINKAIQSIPKEKLWSLRSKWLKEYTLDSYVDSVPKSELINEEEKKWLKSHPKIVLGIEESWSPMVIQNRDGSLSGIDADTIDYINKQLGTNIEFKIGKWSELNEMLKRKEIDGLSSSSTAPQREGYANFTNSYTTIVKSIFVKKDNPLNIKKLQDLSGKRVAIQEGNLHDEKLLKEYKNIQFVYAKDYDELLNLVLSNDADAFIASDITNYNFIKKGMTTIEPILTIGKPLELVLAIRKDWSELIPILNKAINTISEQERNAIKEKYIIKEK